MRAAIVGCLLAFGSIQSFAAPHRGPIFSEPDDDTDTDESAEATPPKAEPSAIEEICDSSLRIVYPSGVILVIGYAQDHLQKINNKTFIFKEDGPVCIGEMGERGRIQEILREGGYLGNRFLVSIRTGNKVQVIEQLHPPQSSASYPFLQWVVSCAGQHCAVSQPACILNVPSNVNPDAVKKARQWMRKRQHFDSFEDVVKPLLLRALSGDPEARGLLLEGSFGLDGIDKDYLSAARNIFRVAQQFDCRHVVSAARKPDTRPATKTRLAGGHT